jgi:hypothetical protein
VDVLQIASDSAVAIETLGSSASGVLLPSSGDDGFAQLNGDAVSDRGPVSPEISASSTAR